MNKRKTRQIAPEVTGRPYRLSIDDHAEMLHLYRTGTKRLALCESFSVCPKTVYNYLRLRVEDRKDYKG